MQQGPRSNRPANAARAIRHAVVPAIAAVFAAALLAACHTTPPPVAAPAAVSLTTATPQQMTATVRAAGGTGSEELAVQPLREASVEDLRQDAVQLEKRGDYAGAAKALDQALVVEPNDPALLQERAEAALLQGNTVEAEKIALRAYETGSQVGPLCRRHWATVQQARLVAGDAAGAASAQKQVDGCKVAAPNRF